MPNTLDHFLQAEEVQSLGITERLVAQIWWHHRHDSTPVSFKRLSNQDLEAGYPPINQSREKKKLKVDSRIISRDQGKTYALNIRSVNDLDQAYMGLAANKPPKNSDTIFSLDDFDSARPYLKKVIIQINLSYDYALYDCCAVMIRRLLETLIIEAYEKLNRSEELKNSDGYFVSFSKLLAFLKADKQVNLGRRTIKGLEGFKEIADSSAHNMRFNATKKIIDDKIDGVKLAVVELREMAFGS